VLQNTINQITSYLKTHNTSLNSKVNILEIKDKHYNYIYINFYYHKSHVEVFVYNIDFIHIKIDDTPYAFCDSVKTFRNEIDRLHSARYY